MFPNQRKTTKEKKQDHGSIEKWAEENLNAVDSLCNANGWYAGEYFQEILQNYEMSIGRLNDREYESMLKPYGDGKYTFPSDLKHHDIITSKEHLLLGEEMKRPFDFRVVCLNPDAVTIAEEKKKELVVTALDTIIRQQMEEKGILEKQSQDPNLTPQEAQQMREKSEPQTPEQIELFMKMHYQDMREKTSNDILAYLIEKEYLRDKFNNGFRDLLISGCEIYYVDIVSNEPIVRKVDPRFFVFDMSEETDFIEDSAWAKEIRYIPASKVYDEFYEDLTPDQIDRIEEIKGIGGESFSGNIGSTALVHNEFMQQPETAFVDRSNMDSRDLRNTTGFSNYIFAESDVFVKVERMEWKSLRKIGFVSYTEGKEDVEEVVDEDYVSKKRKNEKIEWRWINEVWEVTRIGGEIIVNARPKRNQFRSMDNLSQCKLGYTGICTRYPLYSKIRPLQVLYNIVMYRSKLALARAKGSGFIMDVAQLPTSMGFGIEKWLHYLDVFGIAFINSFEEGKGQFAGKTPQFNQFQQIDMGLSSTFVAYVQFMDKIEQMAGDVTGVTKQREGQVHQSETLGGVERSVTQSSHITEYLFNLHNQVKVRVVSLLLNASKMAFQEGKKVQYVLSDGSRQFLNLEKDNQFLDSEFAVFVRNNAKDSEIIQTIRQLGQQAVQAGILQMSEYITIMESNSISFSKRFLEMKEEAKRMNEKQMQDSQQQSQQQMQQMQQQMAQQNQQFEMQKLQMEQAHEIRLKQMEIEGKLKAEDVKSKTDIEVANIEDDTTRHLFIQKEGIDNKQDRDVNDNGRRDDIDMKKLDVDREKLGVQREKNAIDLIKEFNPANKEKSKPTNK